MVEFLFGIFTGLWLGLLIGLGVTVGVASGLANILSEVKNDHQLTTKRPDERAEVSEGVDPSSAAAPHHGLGQLEVQPAANDEAPTSSPGCFPERARSVDAPTPRRRVCKTCKFLREKLRRLTSI